MVVASPFDGFVVLIRVIGGLCLFYGDVPTLHLFYGAVIGISLARILLLGVSKIRLKLAGVAFPEYLEDGTISEVEWSMHRRNHKAIHFLQYQRGVYVSANDDFVNAIYDRYKESVSKSAVYHKARHTQEMECLIKTNQLKVKAWEIKYDREMKVRFKPSTKQLHAYQEQVRNQVTTFVS